MRIRHEREEDRAAIYAVHAAAFPTEAEARLVEQLRSDGDLVLSLVAETGADIAGHVAFSRMQAPFRALGLAPVGVNPGRQREGIGSALVREGLRCARDAGWQGVFVLGDVYYERFGFRVDLAAGFSCPYSGPHFMALALGVGLPATSGALIYAPAFAALD